MSLSLTNTTKISLTITNQDKKNDDTWDEATYTWDEATGTWDTPGLVLSKDSKNSLTITNETKN